MHIGIGQSIVPGDLGADVAILVDALKFCLMTKYGQSGAFREELARTGDRFIVEKNVHARPDTYNARLSDDGTVWSGPNLMGRLLMELRDNGGLEYSLPDGISEFRDLRPTADK